MIYSLFVSPLPRQSDPRVGPSDGHTGETRWSGPSRSVGPKPTFRSRSGCYVREITGRPELLRTITVPPRLLRSPTNRERCGPSDRTGTPSLPREQCATGKTWVPVHLRRRDPTRDLGQFDMECGTLNVGYNSGL